MTPAPAVARDLAPAALALARRFAAGATLWCLSPQWPSHAAHVAVEFVHPVIVGKQALPAEAVTAPDPVAVLRANVRSGDVILAISDARNHVVADVLRRAGAWGADTIWVGAGERPAAGAAGHVLWLDCDPAGAGPLFVRIYHLLWELAHVCLEHKGLLAATDPTDCDGPVCITCSDEGRLAEVLSADDDEATVRTAEGRERVDITLLGPARPGDLLLVHAGTAITSLEEEGR